METIVVSTEVLCVQKKRFRALSSPYHIDLMKEMKKRWLVFGVLAAVLLAVISPRVGAPGGKQPACSLVDHSRTHCTHDDHEWKLPAGPLRAEYLCYAPAALIYFGAGARLAPAAGPPRLVSAAGPPRRAPAAGLLRLAVTAALHAHVAAPALAVCTVTMFGDALHRPVVTGALLASLGGGRAWLTLALSPHAAAAPVAAGCQLTALVATPLSVLLLCGQASAPAAGAALGAGAAALLPFLAGAALRLRPPRAAARAAALALLYADCCERLADAGGLFVGDVLATLLVEALWAGLCVAASLRQARWCGAAGARLVAAAAVPTRGPDGWGAACGAGLARLPLALAAPAQALLLAAVHCDDDDDDDDGQDQLPG